MIMSKMTMARMNQGVYFMIFPSFTGFSCSLYYGYADAQQKVKNLHAKEEPGNDAPLFKSLMIML
jgi:hypothetical protein